MNIAAAAQRRERPVPAPTSLTRDAAEHLFVRMAVRRTDFAVSGDPGARVGFGRWRSYFWPGSAETDEICPGGGRGPVRDPRQRGDAPADAGRARRAALAALAGALAGYGGSGGRLTRGRDPRMAGARLQPARAQLASRGSGDRGRRLAGRPHRAAGDRAVHRRGDREPGFGEPVLPVDTNVRRIQERTGHAFGSDARRRSSTSARRSASRVCHGAARARSPSAARPGAAATSRCAASRASRAPSVSDAPRC